MLFKLCEFLMIVLYVICLIVVSVNMDAYTAVYPDEAKIYIFKVIISAILLSIQTTPLVGNFKQDPLFYILLWLSCLSIYPDALICLLFL